jgi:hypothetical protein
VELLLDWAEKRDEVIDHFLREQTGKNRGEK